MKTNTLNSRAQTAVTVAAATDLGMAVLKRMSGGKINGALLEGYESKFALHLRNAIAKKETLA